MYELATIARPYAKASFEHGKAHNALNQWQELFRKLLFVFEYDKIKTYLSNPMVDEKEKVETLLTLVDEKEWKAYAQAFLMQLASHGRLMVLPKIAELFEVFLQKEKNEKTAMIDSAYALSDIEREKIAQALSDKFNCKIQVKTNTNEDLLGGVVVKIDDTVIDASVKGHLEKLAASLI